MLKKQVNVRMNPWQQRRFEERAKHLGVEPSVLYRMAFYRFLRQMDDPRFEIEILQDIDQARQRGGVQPEDLVIENSFDVSDLETKQKLDEDAEQSHRAADKSKGGQE